MTSFIQAVSRHAAFAGAPRLSSPGLSSHGPCDTAQREEAEYQTVFALAAALLFFGVTVALTGLMHAF